jgi:hypothetical protein
VASLEKHIEIRRSTQHQHVEEMRWEREANKVADWLANFGCTLANGSMLFEYLEKFNI